MEGTKIELKPCPFCGGEADIFTSAEVGYLRSNGFTVRCCNCFCGTGMYKDIARAKEAWNRRVDDGLSGSN